MRILSRAAPSERGYAMAALLIMLSVMSVTLSMLLPAWGTMAKREREAELVFRGNQYARAVAMYQRSRGAFPPSVDVLVNEKFLRKKYKDPMTEDGEFQIISVGTPIPGQTTPPAVPGRGGAAGLGRGSVGTGLGAAQQGRGQSGLGQTGMGQTGGLGTGATLGSGIGAGTPAAASGFNRVTRPGTGVSGPVLGVVSKSEQTSLRLFNGRNKYNEWAFVATEANQQAGGGGTAQPGGRGTQRPGMEGRGRGVQSPGMGTGGRGMPRGSGASPLQLPGLGGGGRGRGSSPFTVP
jgi:type II secretory pathway pseudopilin PulG